MEAHPKVIRRKIFNLAWPLIIQNFLYTLMYFVDTLMVGSLGAVVLAATGITGPVMWFLSAILMSIGIGTVAMVARSVGEKNVLKARTYAATAYLLGIIGGLIITVIGVVFSEQIAELFTKDQRVVSETAGYMRIVFCSFVFNYISMIGSSILRSAGDTRTPMKITVFTNILNIIGNYIFIFGKLGMPALGLQGAGLSTAICKVVEGYLISAHIFSERSVLRLYPENFKMINYESIRQLLRVSLPAAFEPFVVQSGMLVFTRIVTSLGTIAMASHRVAVAIESLSFNPGIAFSMACATLVGQKLGEKSERGVRQIVKQSLIIAVAIMSCFGIIFFIFPSFLARMFTDNKSIISNTTICLMIGAFEQPFLGAAMVFRGAFQGAGETKTPVYIGAVSVWGPRLILSYLLSIKFELGLAGIWIATTVDWMCRTILYAWRYHHHKHKFKEIIALADSQNLSYDA